MATAVISACLPTLRPVFASFCHSIELSKVVSSIGERSRGISLPDRLEHKTIGTAPPSSRASINREEMVWTHIGHAAKESDANSSCVCDGDTATTCVECYDKSKTGPISITTEVHHEYGRRGTTGSDGTSQKQSQVQTFSVV